MIVRYAERKELSGVNTLRRMVNTLHAEGRPDIFRQGFCEELENHVYDKFDSDDSDVIVACDDDGTICGFATVEYIRRPLSPYNNAREYYHIEEFGVAEKYRRRGVATALVDFCRNEARKKGFPRIELDVWQFNTSAIAFYEAIGFSTYRRYMELDVEDKADD